MIKVEVIEKFTLEDYNKLKNVEKVQKRKENEFGVKDTFECDKEMVDYLTGNNAFKKIVVKVIEVIPEIRLDDYEPVKVIVDYGKEYVTPLGDMTPIAKEIEKATKKPKKKKSSKK